MHSIDAHGRSVTGRGRKRNEDALLLDSRNGIFVVADGVGGRPGGGRSSRLAAATLAETVLQFAPADRTDTESLKYAAQAAHDAVRAMAADEPHLDGAGTTLSAVVVAGSVCSFVHVGDSRIYRFSGGRLVQITRDHTLAGDMIARRELTAEDARMVPFGNALSRVIGNGKACLPDVAATEFGVGDSLILVTDGLWRVLADDRLERVLARSNGAGAEAACDAIMAGALKERPVDDTTVAVIRLL